MQIAYMAVGIISVCIIAGIIIILLSRRQYKPIASLHEMVAPENEVANQNELAAITDAILRTNLLKNEVQSHKELIKDELLLHLLNGDLGKADDAVAILQQMGVLRGGGSYCVISLKMVKSKANAVNGPLIRYIQEQFGHDGSVNALEMMNAQFLSIIICAQTSAELAEETVRVVDCIDRFVRESTGESGVYGVSSPHPLNQLAVAHLESRAALQYPYQSDAHHMIFFHSLYNAPQFDREFQKHELLFIHSLQKPNPVLAHENLRNILTLLEDRYTANAMRRYYSFRLAEAAVRVVTDEVSVFEQIANDLERLSVLLMETLSTNDLDVYSAKMREITDVVCTISKKQNTGNENSARRKVEQWMAERISDPSLSLELLIGEMGYSTAYWSRFFREKMSTSFNDYVWSMRKEIVKKALIHTEQPIKEVVTGVGYIDVSSFIRRFKKDEGVTPGQFRSIHATDK